jgi:hypothetical protein
MKNQSGKEMLRVFSINVWKRVLVAAKTKKQAAQVITESTNYTYNESHAMEYMMLLKGIYATGKPRVIV